MGGYNHNLIANALQFNDDLVKDKGKEVLLYVIGNKGTTYLKFIDRPVYKSTQNLEDKLSFKDISVLGDEVVNLFVNGDVDEVYISYTGLISSASHKPMLERLLPIKIPEVEVSSAVSQIIYEPNPDVILSSLLPLYLRTEMYIKFIESNFSEQSARRIAMKNATDAATDMVRELTIKYNRARQAKITSEIAEIVGGASALE